MKVVKMPLSLGRCLKSKGREEERTLTVSLLSMASEGRYDMGAMHIPLNLSDRLYAYVA